MQLNLPELISSLQRLNDRDQALSRAQDKARTIALRWFADDIRTGEVYLDFCLSKLEDMIVEKLKQAVENATGTQTAE